jgi:hypothetical protein
MKGWSVAPLALAFGLAVAPAQAQIDGPLRETFTQSFKASCLKTQRDNPANRGVTNNLLGQYCACNAAYFAQRVTADLLSASAPGAAKGETPAWFTDYSGAASNYCSQDLGKFSSVAS